MIDYKRASYLSERKYRENPAEEQCQELSQYWENILGEKGLDFLMKKYPDELFGFLGENEYEAVQWQERGTYLELESMYESGGYHRANVWQYIEREQVVFPDFYEPFLELALEWAVRQSDVGLWTKEMIRGYLKALVERFQSVSMRSLILEMYISRQEGKLKGEDSAGEYEYYQRHYLGQGEYLNELKGYYPVMFRCMLEIIEMSADLYVTMIHRFTEDLKEINDQFYRQNPAVRIMGIDGKMADTHRNGQSVQKLMLDNGEILIYKPHSVKNERTYAQMVQWIYDKCVEKYSSYGVLEKEQYGWCQFVEYKSCTMKNELEDYYRKLGMNLFAAYFLGTGDLHCENLIANGAEPVIVDVETLTKMPEKSQTSGVNGKIKRDLEGSVLYLGILPFYSWDKNGNGINISAVSGAAGQVAQIKMPVIVNPKTSDMHVEYQNPVMEGSSNLALLNGTFVEPQKFSKELEEGFEKAYQAVLGDRKGFLSKLQIIHKTQSRYLVRDTQQYMMALISSYHPDFLSDGAERELSLCSLYEGKSEERTQLLTVESEIEELLRGDIPYFFYEASNTSLCGGSGREIPGYFETTIMKYLEERLWKLDQKDLEMQIKYIQMSMNMMPEMGQSLFNSFGKVLDTEPNHNPSSQKLLEMAGKIGDGLLESAIYNETHTEIGWTGIVLAGFKEQEWHIQPVNLYLYGGIAGICLFFHALYQEVGQERYREVYAILDAMLFDYTDRAANNLEELLTRNTGAYEGEGSIVWMYQLLYTMTKKTRYLIYAERHCKILEQLIEEDKLYDLLQGNAGAVAVFLNMWNLTGSRQYLNLAVRAGEILERNVEWMSEGAGWPSEGSTKPLLGMSHGSSGIQCILFWLGKEVKEENNRFTRLAVQALAYEDSCYCEEQKNWKDYRDLVITEEECYKIGPVAWCHGAAGILMARSESIDYAPPKVRKILEQDLENALDKTVQYAVRDGHCLCHGCCGNMEIIRRVSKRHSINKEMSDRMKKLCRSYTAALIETVERGGKGMLPQEKEHPGLMTGMAGIGYFLLLSVEENLPQILFPRVNGPKK